MEGNDDKEKKRIGKFYEYKFMNVLRKYGVPFLYIDQDPYEKTDGIQRPDFLLYFQRDKQVFIDVKSRTKIKCKDNDNASEFYLNSDEIERLYLSQSRMLLPVWIAFTEIDKLIEKDIAGKYKEKGIKTVVDDFKDANTLFYFVPINALKTYKDRLTRELNANNAFDLLFLRVPMSFCKEFVDTNNLLVNTFDFDNLKNTTAMYENIYKTINNSAIKDDVNSYKNVSDYVVKENIKHIMKKEFLNVICRKKRPNN